MKHVPLMYTHLHLAIAHRPTTPKINAHTAIIAYIGGSVVATEGAGEGASVTGVLMEEADSVGGPAAEGAGVRASVAALEGTGKGVSVMSVLLEEATAAGNALAEGAEG